MNWRRGFLSVALVFLCSLLSIRASGAAAPETGFFQKNPASDEQPPVAGRPADFSGAKGVFQVSTRAQPTVLQAQDTLLFTVRITGSGSLDQLERPDLRHLPRFSKRFAIKDAGQRNLPEEKAREFDYELRPLSAAVKEIPAFPFVYWRPGIIPDYLGYQTALAPAIPLTVRPQARVQPSQIVGPTRVESAPESVYVLAEGPSLLRRDRIVSLPGPLVLALFMVGPPLLCAAWLISWKRRHPDLASQARQRCSRAAGRALQALRNLKAPSESQGAQAAAAILVEYLREHLGFAALEPAPGEVASFLETLGLAPEKRAKTRVFFENCLAARFGPPRPSVGSGPGANWAATASQLVEEWEDGQQSANRNRTPGGAPSWAAVAFLGLLAAAWAPAFGQDFETGSRREPTAEPLTDTELLAKGAAAFHEAINLREQPEEARRRFLTAAAAFTALQERGFLSAALARNTGNAYLLGGDLPRAILEYCRGLRLQPADVPLRANLAYARAQVAYPQTNGFARPSDDSPLTALLRASFRFCLFPAAALYALAWLALVRWWILRTTSALAIGLGASLLTACLSLCLVFDVHKEHEEIVHPLVVVAQDDVLLRKGNGFSYPLRSETPLYRGVEARLLHSRGDWLQIELAGGEIGWIPKASALVSAGPS